MPEFRMGLGSLERYRGRMVYEMLSFINKNTAKIKTDNIRFRLGPEKWAQWPD